MKLLRNVLLFSIILTAAPKLFAQTTSSNTAEIKWYSITEAEQMLKKDSKKKILIDIYTDWCGWCKKLDATTYKDASVIEYMNKHFIAVKLNAESQSAISYKGQEYKYDPSRRQNAIASEFMGSSTGYPTTSFVDEKLTVVSVVPGYMAPEMMLNVLTYIGDDNYKSMDWNSYLSKVNSQ